jgi:hypothetical protein
MAKKKSNPEETTNTTPLSAPVRRRAPAKKRAVSPAATASAPDSGRPEPARTDHVRTEPTRDEIAVAAYFRHLNRQGSAGDEFDDWVAAERELKQRR